MASFNNKLDAVDSISQFLNEVSFEYSNRVAFEIRRRIINERVFYKDIPHICIKIQRLLFRNGLKNGDSILVYGLNCPEYALLLLAIFSNQFTAVPVDFRTHDETLGKIIDQTKPRLIFCSRFLSSSRIKNFKKVLYIEDLFSLLKDIPLLKGKRKNLHLNRLSEIVYTSGTTGTPKGVMISEENLLSNLKSIKDELPRMDSYRTISVLPLSHMYEQVGGLLLALSVGSTVSYLTRINSAKLKRAFLEIRPTYLLFVPQLLTLFWDKITLTAKSQNSLEKLNMGLRLAKYLPRLVRKLLFSKIHNEFGGFLEYIACAGAPLNIPIATYFNRIGFKIIQGYGATEVTAVATFNRNPDTLFNVGSPVKGVEIRTDTDGQILIRSKSVSKGYFNNQKKTKESFRSGWYRTGDIGKINGNGNLEITGRDFFKIVLASGEKVYVEDVEGKILLHPLVRDVCVLGVRKNSADMIHAVIILKNSENTIDTVISQINSTLESKQQIFSYSVWQNEDFPRTATLKIDRRQVGNIIGDSLDGAHPEASQSFSQSETTDVLEIISQISKVSRLRILDSDILTSDLGMDSIDRSELTAMIEENMGVYIDTLEIHSKTTVSDIKNLISHSEKNTERVAFHTWQFTPKGEILRSIFQRVLVFPFHSLFVQMRIVDKRKLSKLTPGVIIIFNHAGLFDGVCILRMLNVLAPKTITPVYGELWKKKLFAKIIELTVGGLPLNQQGKDLIPLLQTISDRMDGRFLLFAPQGRMQKVGQQDNFKVGVGYFAKELKLPIVPIKISKYEDIWPAPKYGSLHMTLSELLPKKRGVVEISIGDTFTTDNLQSPVEIANLIQEHFEKL